MKKEGSKEGNKKGRKGGKSNEIRIERIKQGIKDLRT